MRRSILPFAAIALIFLFVGVATTAGVLAFIPNPGSPPSIYDDFNFSTTSNGFWHVNAIGGQPIVKNGIITIRGNSIELDKRVQTDPYQTIVVAKVRGLSFDKFGLGLGVYHAGTIALEFDSDGIKCGRGTDHGWKIDFLKGWSSAPVSQWFYLELAVTNPYPNVKHVTEKMKKKVTVVCSAYDPSGRLIASERPTDPPPNASYAGIDEAFFRTWDSHNDYQLDWFYAGPPSGNPMRALKH